MDAEKPNEDIHVVFWRAIYDQLALAKQTLPLGTEPETFHWANPDEKWKSTAHLEQLEEAAWTQTDSLISYYCQNQKWPKRSQNNARFFALQRLKWARNISRLFTIPDDSTNSAVIPRPQQSGWNFLRWLLVDAYRERFEKAPETPLVFGSSDLGLKMTDFGTASASEARSP
jgi:hypothetical protein